MKKCLFLIESLKIGGAERALVTLLKSIDKSKYDITVLSIVDGGSFSEEIKSIKGLRYKYIASKKSSILDKLKIKMIYRWFSPEAIYKLFVPRNNDVEIAFCEGLTTKIIGSSTNTKAKHIAWVHTDLKDNNWPVNCGVFSSLEEEISYYNKFDNVVGVSNTVCERLFDLIKSKNITRVYNLVDKEFICEKANEVSDFTLYQVKINIVSVGRLETVKGFDRLVNVVSKLVDVGYDNFSLIIVGGGSLMGRLSDLLHKKKLDHIVTLTGQKDNPYAIMKGRDLFVCPSRNEGFNIAIAEAMILGLPVVSTWCPGPNEILQDGKYGILCDNNEDGLYQAIKEILDNPSLLQKYAKLSICRTTMFEKGPILNQLYQLI